MTTSEHPLKYLNSTGASIPAFGIFKLEGGTRQSSGELNPHAELSTATGEEALYVNSALSVANNGYGNCRSCNEGRFWVLYNSGDAPNNGDVVGPVSGQTYVDATGEGLVVIYKDTAKGLVLCEKLGGGACSCLTVHEIATNGAVTGGTVILDVSIDDGSTVTTENVTLNWNDTAAAVKTAFEGHSKIASGDISTKGGPLPDTAVYVVYLTTGDLNRDQAPPTLDTNSLTGTNVRIKTGYMTCADWEA